MTPPTFLLKNSYWDKVSAIINLRNFANCDENQYLQTVTLEKGETYIIPTNEQNICWKRDTNPDHPDGFYTNWRTETINLFEDRQTEVELD